MANPIDSLAPDAPPPPAVMVKEIEIHFRVKAALKPDGTLDVGQPNTYESRYTFDRLAADGSIVNVRSGPYLDKIAAAKQTALKGLLDEALAKAQQSTPVVTP